MRLTSAFAATAVLSGAVVPAVAVAATSPYGMSIRATGNHARPLPGEQQIHSFTVGNTGTEALKTAWIGMKAPADWAVDAPGGCRPEDDRILCALGTLSPGETQRITFRLTVPRRPVFGPSQVKTWTGATTPEGPYEGPFLALHLMVVKSR